MIRIFLFLLALSGGFVLQAQDVSPEMRAKFVKDQDAYLEKLQMGIDQNKLYKITTIKYDKMVMNVDRSTLSKKAKKKRIKSIEKAKNTEMRAILNDWQYKLYLVRQKEIKTGYRE
ncbi:MAG: hypothetical protein JXQ90_17780 [Cyclobacteriaceae bacterium]